MTKGKCVPKALLDAGYNFVNIKIYIKPSTFLRASRLTLTKNEIKDVVEVIRSLENRGLLLKRTTSKVTSQELALFNFPKPLMTAGLPLMTIS